MNRTLSAISWWRRQTKYLTTSGSFANSNTDGASFRSGKRSEKRGVSITLGPLFALRSFFVCFPPCRHMGDGPSMLFAGEVAPQGAHFCAELGPARRVRQHFPCGLPHFFGRGRKSVEHRQGPHLGAHSHPASDDDQNEARESPCRPFFDQIDVVLIDARTVDQAQDAQRGDQQARGRYDPLSDLAPAQLRVDGRSRHGLGQRNPRNKGFWKSDFGCWLHKRGKNKGHQRQWEEGNSRLFRGI